MATTTQPAPTDEEQWKQYKEKFGKSYKDGEEESQRFQIFQLNLRQIEDHNKQYEEGSVTWTMGVNQFTDLTKEEFANRFNRCNK